MATYVEISREEFEDWLDSLGKKWNRAPKYEGVYLVHFGPNVALSISSSIGRGSQGLARGRAAIHMRLVSIATGQVLNKKGLGQSRFNRTTNWRTNLLKGVRKFEELYNKSKSFYDSIAVVADRDGYKSEWMEKIESAPGWEGHRILADIYKRLEQGRVLSQKQETLVEKIILQLTGPKTRTSPQRGRVDEALVQRLREFWKAGKRKRNQWVMDRAVEWADLVKRGRSLSPKQMAVIDRELGPVRRASAVRVASRYLSAT